MASTGSAADFSWDPAGDQTNSGGAGIWDTTSLFWNDDAAAPNVAWPNLNDSVALFGGTGGIVTINNGGTGVTANGLTFNVTGYTIASQVAGDVLTLAGTTPTVTVTNLADSATISGIISGSSLTKAGLGTLVLSGANTYSGVTTINAGVLSIASAGNLGDASATNTIAFGGGTLRSTATLDLGANRSIAVNAGGGTLDNATGLTTTVSGTVSSGAGNALTKTGLGTLVFGAGAADAAANTTSGVVNVNGGTLDLSKADGTDAIGAGGVTLSSSSGLTATLRLLRSNQINNAAVITTNSAGGALASFNLNNFSETVGGIVMNGTTNGGNSIITGATGVLTLNGDITMNNNRGATGNTGREVLITGTGTYGTATPSGTLDLGSAVRTITVNTSTGGFANNDATIETVIQNGGIIKAGARTLNLTNPGNTFAGGLTANAGLVGFTADGGLGAVANVITLNGGGLSWTPTAQYDPPVTRVFNIGASGGILDVVAPLATGKILINDAAQLSGSSNITKTGAGVVQITAGQTAYTGNWTINGGTVEANNTGSLGTGGTVTANTGGELALGGITFNNNNIVLAGGAIGTSTTTGSNYSGSINITANSFANARQFQTPTTGASTVTISGTLTGSGNLTAQGPTTSGTGTIIVSGTNNSGYSGNLGAGTNAIMQINSAAAKGTGGINLTGGTVRLGYTNAAAGTAGSAGLNATYYNFGLNPNATTNPQQYAVDQIFLNPRAFSRVDPLINLPNGGSGNFPVVPVAGYAATSVGGVNDGVMWKGLLNITTGGSYQFSGTNDDNLILIIDGVTVGTLGVQANNTNIGSAVTLSAGAHSIVVKQSQATGGGYTTLSYNGPDSSGSTTLIPSSAFTTGSLAATDLGPVTAAGGTLDIVGPASTSSLSLGNGTFTLTSNTIDNLTAAGGTITAATPTLAPTTAGLIVTGAIGQSSAGLGLNFAGPYFAEFQGTNTFTGTTTVTGGQLRLNATGGDSIAGNLTVNAANALGPVANVRLLQPNQIADTATVLMTTGILDIGANSDTIGNLTTNGGSIIGTTGVLTVNNAPTLNGGFIGVGLAGNYNLVKTGAGILTLAGASTYAGVTNINGGIVIAQATNALGVGGAGNQTTVATGASLRTSGAAMLAENFTINGTGLATDPGDGALRNTGGTSQVNAIFTGAASTIRVDSGELIVNGAFDQTGGAITKTGDGTLTFATNQSSIPLTGANHAGGALGFSGTQSFGAVSVPAGLAYQFNNSQAGSTIDVTVPATGTVIGNFAFDNTTLVNKLNAASTGTLAMATDNSNALNFTGVNVSLGAKGNVIYSGTITPNAAGYRLGGGGGRLFVDSLLSGANPVAINGDVQLDGTNTFTGNVTLNSGGRLFYVNNQNVGTASNTIVLNGGTLVLAAMLSDVVDGTRGMLEVGHPKDGSRIISVGAGGGTIDLPSRQATQNFSVIGTTNGLTGSGALTKTGLGFLGIFNPNDYSGALTIGSSGGRINLRAAGALPNVASVTLEPAGQLDIDNNTTTGATRVWSLVDTRNRLNDAAPIALNGGTLRFVARNVAFAAGTPATSQENFGVTTAGIGQSRINSTRTGGGGADMVISNLIRNYGSGTVIFTTDGNTLGQSGDNPRIILTQLNGAAPTVSSLIGGWATINEGDFAAYGANSTVGGSAGTATGVTNFGSTGAPTYTTVTSATAPGTNGWTATSVGNAAADNTLGAAGNGQNFEIRALRLAGAATRQILFAGTTGTADTLYVVSGGVLSENVNNPRNIGVTTSAFTRGRLTAGSTTATTPQELFFHQHQNTLTVNAQVIDNPAGGTVRVVKGQGGTVALTAANTYTGGTLIVGGVLQASVAGAFGTGGVSVKNAQVTLSGAGSTTGGGVAAGLPVYTLTDQANLLLTSGGAYNGAGDRFSIGTGSSVYANSGTNVGYNSLTRVATPTGMVAGDIFLAPGAILRHNVTNAPNQGTGTLTIKNLGTAADLFFAPATATNTAAYNQTITVGAGTPWAGLSSDRGNVQWNGGTIFANSDFVLQGLLRDGGLTALTLGENTTATQTATKSGGVQIVNNTNGPINATVRGQVIIAEDEPVTMPSDLTFVLTAGSLFQPNTSMAMGFGSSQAKIVIQAAGTLDPGNYTNVGNAANTNKNLDGTSNGTQNLPYALPSPVNGLVTVEAGGRFLINDASGIGSAPAGSYTFKTDSILEIGNTNSFWGRGLYGLTQTGPVDTTGVAVPGQFVYEPGVVVRWANVSNVYKVSQFTPTDAIHEITGGNLTLTSQVNPFIIPVAGTPTTAPEDITLGSGGMVTNENNDRTLSEGRGRLMLNNGAVLAATNATYFSVQEGFNLAAGATLTIGDSRYISGMPKLGAVQLNGPNSNVGGAGSSVTVIDGAQLSFASTNVFPDNVPISLPAAVAAFPGTGGFATQPATGSTLLLNQANFMEYTGHVTGDGTVMANQTNTALAINTTSNFSSNVVFKSTNGQNPSLVKAGPATLTLTGASDSTGVLVAQQGEVVVGGTGTGNWNEVRMQKGGKVTVDNSGTAITSRLGTPGFLVGQGGTFELIGHATTPVTGTFTNIATGAGNFINVAQAGMQSTIKITPGAATTTLSVNVLENFQSAGQRISSYLVNSPSVANGPLTYGTAHQLIPNVGNSSNGLLEVFAPNFGFNAAFGIGAGQGWGSSGTPVVPVRNDFLGDANGDGVPEGFMTEDGVNYPAAGTSGTNTITGLPTTVGLAVGMPVIGTGIPTGTRIATIASGTSVTLTQNLTATAANLNAVVGGMRNLAASEYTANIRDHQSTVGYNVKLPAGTTSTFGDTRFSTLTMSNGSTLNIEGKMPFNSTMGRVHLNAGGIFVPTGAAATINGGTAGGTRSFLQTNGGTSLMLHLWGDLNLNASIFTDIGVVKTGPGTLNLGADAIDSYRTLLQVDAGTVNLAAGAVLPNVRSQNGSTSASHLFINGGTLNLNGNSQMIGEFRSANELPGTGGTITSATAATILNTGGGRFAGVLDGAISLDKNANNTLLLTSAQTYTGATMVRAGTLVLRDSAALGASAGTVTVRDATLQFDNGYLSNVTNRINPATPIVLNGATHNITGAAGQMSSQTYNTVTLEGGQNLFSGNAGGSGATEVSIGNLIRPNGSGAAVNFTAAYGNLSAGGNTTTAVRNMITNVNGSPLALNDGILAGWAVVNGDHFATYLGTTGVGAMSNTTDGYQNYESTDVSTATATQNVSDVGAARTLATTKTVNAYRVGTVNSATATAAVITINSGVGLTIDTGGLITNNNQAVSFNAAADARSNSFTSNSGELNVWNNQNNSGINVPVTGAIDLVKSGPGLLNLNPGATLTGTATSGSTTIAMANTTGLEIGDAVSGGTASVFPAGTVITAINPGVSITVNNAPTTGGADFRATFGNTYTGRTIVNAGTLQLNQPAASQSALAIPGDLLIMGNGTVVTEANVAGQIKNTANITIGGGARLNMAAVAGATETINSLTFLDGSSATGTSSLDRTASQQTSTVVFTAPTAITSTNTNPSTGVPFIGGFIGNLGFTNAGGATLNITSPTDVNGVLAVGLRIAGAIGAVPTGIADGGLIKSGTGLLVLSPDQTVANATNTLTSGSAVITSSNTAGLTIGMPISGTGIPAGSFIKAITPNTNFTISQNVTTGGTNVALTGAMVNFNQTPTTYDGTLGTLNEVFNVQTGMVRVDNNAGLGSNSALTTFQSGTTLLASNNASVNLTGSIKLNGGSTMGATINAFSLGNATATPSNQSVLWLPSGTVNISTADLLVPGTNSGNITVNGRLTGAGNINLVGQQLMQGNGAGGVFTIANPITAGTGSNDYTGTITVGTNAQLLHSIAAVGGATRVTGNSFGGAAINLAGGRLLIRDDATSGGTAVSNTAVNYTATNVTLSESSWLAVGRVNTSDTNSGNIIDLGTLTVTAGTKALNVDSNTATTAGAGLGNYIARFASLDGSGTLVKAGGSRLQFNAIAGTFTGGINIAGPVGITLAPATNPNLILPTTAALPTFSVNGLYITEASKTLNVTTLAVNANPGDVNRGQANVSGRVGVTSSTTINAGTVQNNGVMGPIGGAVTLNASTGFTGAGTYITTNATAGATSSNPLTLAGNVTAGTLRTAGLNTVTVTGAAHTPAGAEVQSGTLKLAPTGNATTSGALKVFGSPASTASATTAAISAVTGTLDFAAPAANTISHTGDITNSGLVKISTGTATVSGTIGGSATPLFVPGLLEGIVTGTTSMVVDGTRPANPGNFGIQMEPRMFQNNNVTQQALTGHIDNEVWVYTGYIKDDDGVFSLAANIDDNAAIWIDGALVLNIGGNLIGSTAYKTTQAGNGVVGTANGGTPSQDFGAGISLPGFGSGWHLIEIRMRNGTGGAGPYSNNGFGANYGMGYKNGIAALDGADMIKPIDDGAGSMFVTPLNQKGSIQVDVDSRLNAGRVTETATVTLNGGGGPGTEAELNLTTAAASAADTLTTTGAAGGLVDIAAGGSLTVQTLSVSASGRITVNPNNTGTLTIATAHTLGASAVVEVQGGLVEFNGTGGDASAVVNVTAGTASVDGSLTATVNVDGGILNGDGTIVGAVNVISGELQPGNSAGSLATGSVDLQAPATLRIEIGGSPASGQYDQVIVTGGITLAGDLEGSLINGFIPTINDTFYIMLNDGSDAVAGTFAGLNEGDTVLISAIPFSVTYIGNGDAGATPNDVALIAQIPEPGSLVSLLGGMATLIGLQRFRRRRE